MQRLSFSLLIVAGAAVAIAAEEKVAEAPKALLGAWQSEEDKANLARFEPKKCTFFEGGQLQIRRATYEPGKVRARAWGRTAVYGVEIKDGVLTLTAPDGKKKTHWRKLDRLPPQLEAKPLPLGAAKELAADKTKTIQEELVKRGKIDQEVRKAIQEDVTKAKADPPDPANDPRYQKMREVDTDNTAYLTKLVQEVGWIDVSRFGVNASNAAFLIVQHSNDLPLMLAALPPIETDVRARRLDVQAYALLYDRVQIMLGEKQKYGSQIGAADNGELLVLALQDRAKVEAFRKEIGLFPLADYLKLFEAAGKKVKFEDD
jgi:polyhydroxyalkanoate synthesis regulator phasin